MLGGGGRMQLRRREIYNSDEKISWKATTWKVRKKMKM
jgi:hypothetical protein